MKLTILGSGTNRVSIKRSAPAYLLEVSGKNILIDTGAGCARQLLRAGKHILDIDAILYTHFHKDHYLDLPVILNELKHQIAYPEFGEYPKKKVKKIKIYGPSGVKKIVAQWNINIPMEVKTINKREFNLFGTRVKSNSLKHIGEIIGYRISEKGKTFVFTSDSKYCKKSVELASKADVLLHSVGLSKRYGAQEVHPTPGQAGMVAQEAMVKKLVLTHFYPAADKRNNKKDVKKFYKGKLILGEDLMKIKI
ncbi:MAG: MBL fold metallo-hydrolase [Patescibacteria group bacterium]|jgi:ribonuclease BN (tRNA processing enzyme)